MMHLQVPPSDDDASRRAGKAHLEKLLIEGLESGPAVEVTPEYWRQWKEELSRKVPAPREWHEAHHLVSSFAL